MTDRPIIMSPPMILATLREVREPGTGKTMTRRLLYTDRVAKDGIVPASVKFLRDYEPCIPAFGHYWTLSPWHRVKAGDRLYVRENFSFQEIDGDRIEEFGGVHYWADGNPEFGNWTRPKPSIHLPRLVSRLTLIVTGTKIERLQDLTEADAQAEGAEPAMAGVGFNGVPAKTYRTGFVHLWGSLHGTASWMDNPWVVAVSFRPVLANIDSLEIEAA